MYYSGEPCVLKFLKTDRLKPELAKCDHLYGLRAAHVPSQTGRLLK